jgi:RNA polymerase sigma-70 factor (ECF subfamily)
VNENEQSPDALDRIDMERLTAGHDAALSNLMERHSLRLFHYLVRQLRDESEAEDVSQETFVRVYQHSKKFDLTQKFSTWLYTIATNLVKDRFRYRSSRPQVSLDTAADESNSGLQQIIPDERVSTPSENVEAHERAEAVRKAIADLPEELRTPLILSEYENLSHAEAAEVLSCTAKAIETRLYRARQKLRLALASFFG